MASREELGRPVAAGTHGGPGGTAEVDAGPKGGPGGSEEAAVPVPADEDTEG